jgi:alpha-beta hydrolase superfamily lysophospholipase
LKTHLGYVQPNGFFNLPATWDAHFETIQAHQSPLHLRILRLTKRMDTLPQTILFVIHGYGEHAGRYLHLPYFLQSTVDQIYLLDLRGHGLSEGQRGHITHFEDYAKDVWKVIERIRSQYNPQQARLHVLGHSMGGLVVLNVIKNYDGSFVQSFILSAPALQLKVPISFVRNATAAILTHIAPTLHFQSEVFPHVLSHDKAVQEAYVSDPLIHNKVTPSFFMAIKKNAQEMLNLELTCHAPLLFLVPLSDELIDPAPTLEFYKKVRSNNKDIKKYPDFFHESFNETKKELVFEDMCKWIAQWN